MKADPVAFMVRDASLLTMRIKAPAAMSYRVAM
jgi:hypothetical protein